MDEYERGMVYLALTIVTTYLIKRAKQAEQRGYSLEQSNIERQLDRIESLADQIKTDDWDY